MNPAQLEKELHGINLTHVTKAKELAPGEAIKDLGLSDGELLLVQLPGALSISVLVCSGVVYQTHRDI